MKYLKASLETRSSTSHTGPRKKQADKKQVRRKKAGKKASYTDADNADGDDEGDEKASGNMRILQRGQYSSFPPTLPAR